ncbi:MAG TPA: hypothetical protein VFG62_09365 [Rhodopila sp.]|jgi:hypothetical protein|nr:hypothetical protein [Rhodopila sp.]
MPRCLIGYFGLARLIAATAPAIETCFIAPLREAGFEILRAGHFNAPPVLDNPRSGEHGAVPDSDPARALVLDAWEQEPQMDAAITDAFAIARRYPDAFDDDYRSLRNLCHQLRSLNRLWLLLAAFRPAPDDIVLLLRPDLLYLDRLSISLDLGGLLSGQADLVVPGWQSWGGLNDRFAFATPHAARIYTTRYRLIEDGCRARGTLHAESFLAFTAASHGLRVARTGLRGVRLRANGDIAGNDLPMLKG